MNTQLSIVYDDVVVGSNPTREICNSVGRVHL